MLIDVLKQAVLQIAAEVDDGGDLLDLPCPNEYDLPTGCGILCGMHVCKECWAAAIAQAEKEEANDNA